MTTIRCISELELTLDDLQRWSDFQSADPSLDSPYFRSEFTSAVARVRRDVEIAVVEEAGEPIAYLPFQRDRLNMGRPVGGKLSDYHGLIGRPNAVVDAMELVRGCGLAGWDFDHLAADQAAFAAYHRRLAPSRWMDLSHGFESYCAARRATGTEEIKKAFNKLRKFEREIGQLRFESHTTTPGVLEQLIAWKSDQYNRTGLTDLFVFPWTTTLLRNLLAATTEDFHAELAALWSGDRLIAAMVSLRSRHVLHAWFPAYDSEFASYSPGIGLFLKLAEECPRRGITRIDLGKGEERYKLALTTPGTMLAEGAIERSGPAVWLRKGWRQTKSLLESSSLGAVGRVPLQLLQPIRSWLAFR